MDSGGKDQMREQRKIKCLSVSESFAQTRHGEKKRVFEMSNFTSQDQVDELALATDAATGSTSTIASAPIATLLIKTSYTPLSPIMCRICGRTIKCIFDSMPSRTLIQHTSRRSASQLPRPSRNATRLMSGSRAFTTARTQPTRPSASSLRTPSLSSSFSTLRLSSQTPLLNLPALSTSLRPSIVASLPTTTSILSTIAAIRSFSTTPVVLGKRRRMDTFSPSRKVQKRRHGFLSRQRTHNGRKTLKNRRLRGRKNLSW